MKHPFLLMACMQAIVFLLGGCTPDTEKDAKPTEVKKQITKAKTINVKIEKVSLGTLTQRVIARGVTTAVHDVTYSAEVAGRLGKLTMEIGDHVKKGQVLARIDYKTLAAQAKQAKANLDLATTTHARLMQLKNEDLVAQQQIDEAQSRLIAAQAQLTIAQAQLSKSTVKAGRAGIIANKYAEKAEFVAPGTRLYDVIDYDTIIVEAQLAETQVSQVTSGANVDVMIGGLDKTFVGVVDTIIPSADKVSKTFTLRVKVDNPDLKILVGMSAEVSITSRVHKDVIVTKQSTVVEDQDGRSVFVVTNGVAHKRKVTTGPYENDRVIITSGLTAGEDLVVVGQRELADNQPVTVVK